MHNWLNDYCDKIRSEKQLRKGCNIISCPQLFYWKMERLKWRKEIRSSFHRSFESLYFFYHTSYLTLRFINMESTYNRWNYSILLTKRKQRASINGIYSSWLKITFGIRLLLCKMSKYDIAMSEKFSNILSKIIAKN